MARQQKLLKLLVVFHVWFCYSLQNVITEPPLRPVCPPEPVRCRTTPYSSARTEHFYDVNGKDLMIQFQDGIHFQFTCPDNVTLEDPALPRFNRRVTVEKVIITKCPPPSTSYAEALADLNVTVLYWLHLDDGLFSSETPLEPRHLVTLSESVWKLTITSYRDEYIGQNFTFNPSISDLRLTNLFIPLPVLYNLPLNLRTLHFMNVGLQSIPTAAIERLNRLERIYLHDNSLNVAPEFSAAPNLREVFILAPLQRLPSLAKLENVTLWSVKELTPEVFGNCSELKMLSLGYLEAESLPSEWLKNCSRLDSLELVFVSKLRSLPERLLADAGALRSVTVRYCSDLNRLPGNLFTNTTQLTSLDLSYNNIDTLPSNIFLPLLVLEYLDLSSNVLGPSTRRAFDPLSSLRTLRLENNPLGDLCDSGYAGVYVDGVSSLSHLTSLRQLNLKATNATQLCRDWRTTCSLATIDLQDNDITQLQYDNLQFLCPAKVDLRGNPVESIQYSYDNYLQVVTAAQYKQEVNVTLSIDALVACDCRMYWFARALQQRPAHVVLPDLRCRDSSGVTINPNYQGELGSAEPGTPVTAVSPEDMTCPIDSTVCAENCTCFAKPREHSSGVVRAVCVNSSLSEIPRLPPSAPAFGELIVPGNDITTLTAEDLPESLLLLDLSNNSIAHVPGEVAAALFAVKARAVLLAGNPLACDCSNRLFLLALQAYQNQVLDYGRVSCVDGRYVRDVEASALCTSRAGLRAALAVGSVAVVVAVVVAALVRFRPQLVSRVKAALLRRGICVRWALRPPQYDRDDVNDDKRYDVFVSFAHGDHRFVAECLVPRLETHRYRVCVHYRDFLPGEMINSQIEVSVRNSRRTVVVLTDNFAQSAWGKAEFKFAQAVSVKDCRPRLVVIVLGHQSPEDLPLDQDWKDYLASNTYLRCDDPWFWQRLKVALGRPRPSSVSSAEGML